MAKAPNSAHILISHDGPVTQICLNRPEAMNAVTPAMHERLAAAFDDFAADNSQHVAIISGAGDKAFCAGSDLKDGLATDYPASDYGGLNMRFDLAKPIIAAIDGFALGGGFEIALACDLIIASDRSSFALPEPLIGAVALGGGLHRLPRQIGLKRAMDLILTSRRINAQEGYDMGFVNAVVPADKLDETVKFYCSAILKGSPLAIQASKMTVYKGLEEESLGAAIKAQNGYSEFKKWRVSQDLDEGIKAFKQKRAPIWSGQ